MVGKLGFDQFLQLIIDAIIALKALPLATLFVRDLFFFDS